MIPKIIHYCWFGKNPKPKLAKKCIKSWKKKCPDYKIIEWNEDNFNISEAPLYVRQAYEAKKWAFVTDYVRLYVMTKYGGIYMDSDVQVLSSLDKFLEHDAFSGFEDEFSILTGIMACKKNFSLFIDFLKYYDDAVFINEDGSYNLTTNVEIMTNICIQRGLIQNNTFQKVDGFVLYPKDFFCPISYATGLLNKTKNTVTIHWFSGSWVPKDEKKIYEEMIKRKKREEKKDYIIHIPNRIIWACLGNKRYNKLKKLLKR